MFKMKLFAMSLGVAALLNADAMAGHGQRIYYKGSEAVAAQGGGAPIVAAPAPVVAAPAYQAPPPAAVVPALPAATPVVAAAPGCVNCIPGSAAAKNHGAGTPNAIVTFLHPYTNKAVSVPMTLPVGNPKIITKSDRIIYDYSKFFCLGRYIVVRFFPDGTVMTEYN